MEVNYVSEPKFTEPIMVAAWPGMGYLAKISADYLRRRLRASSGVDGWASPTQISRLPLGVA